MIFIYVASAAGYSGLRTTYTNRNSAQRSFVSTTRRTVVPRNIYAQSAYNSFMPSSNYCINACISRLNNTHTFACLSILCGGPAHYTEMSYPR